MSPETLTATVTKSTMAGEITAAGWFPGLTAGGAWQATRLDDNLPF